MFLNALLLALAMSLPAHAEETPPDAAEEAPTGMDAVDAAFGKYLVAPLAKVLFWDVMFWDNTLADGEGEGLRGLGSPSGESFELKTLLTVPMAESSGQQGWEVTGMKADGATNSFSFQKLFTARRSEVRPAPSEAIRHAMNHVELEITEKDGVLSGAIQPMSINPVEAGLPISGAGLPDGQPFADYIGITDNFVSEPESTDGLWVARGIEEFPVVIRPGPEGLWEVVPTVVVLEPEVLTLEAGHRVRVGDEIAEILSVDEETDAYTLRGEAQFWKAGPLPNPEGRGFPLVVLWLVVGAVFFTLRMQFINLRGFTHALKVTRGDFDDPSDPGEISHFQALSSALSATVGLGNIAGVAIAVGLGGPGALLWMIVAGFLGMSSKFTECSLGQMYRHVDENGQVLGGPMRYLGAGLAELGLPRLGRVLAVVFALMCIGGSLGGGNMFQANQSFAAVGDVVPMLGGEKAEGRIAFLRANVGDNIPAKSAPIEITKGTRLVHESGLVFRTLEAKVLEANRPRSKPVNIVAADSGTIEKIPAKGSFTVAGIPGIHEATNPMAIEGGSENRSWLYGLILAVLVGMVILGGIKRIGSTAGTIVPLMCGVYMLAGLWILVANASEVPAAFGKIFGEAFSPAAIGYGGVIGVLVQGFKRAAFSNEAGVGSAAIAHSAASTNEPIREGVVASLGPFIDTILVCTMTGLVVVITGTYETHAGDGVLMTSAAFESVLPWFPLVLSFAVVMFAFSTMISWSYYGERCATWLFGPRASTPYKYLFLVCVFFGSVFKLGNVLDFSDLMILGMAFPNILGVVLLSSKVKERLDDYWGRLKAGEFDRAQGA